MEIVEVDGEKFIKVGEWYLDAEVCSDGKSLVITVEEPGERPDMSNGRCLDIYVAPDLTCHYL
jgi:hypothetical protein